MRAIPQRGVGIAAALAVLAVLAAPKLIQLRRPSTPASSATSKTILRVKVHRTVPTLLVERLATTGTVRANEEVDLVSEILVHLELPGEGLLQGALAAHPKIKQEACVTAPFGPAARFESAWI